MNTVVVTTPLEALRQVRTLIATYNEMKAAPNDRDAALMLWQEAKAVLTETTLIEKDLRATCINLASSITDEMHSGVENVDIGSGFDFKITHSLSYKLSSADDYAEMHKALDAIEKGENGALLADRLVKAKYEISKKEYDLLPAWAKKLIDPVLTITPAAKSVEIKKRAR